MPRGALRRTPAWGALLVSFFVGAALIAALIDIPIFARTTVYPDSQLTAALVLVRFLRRAAGGRRGRRLPHPRLCPPGSSPRSAWLLAAVGFVLMSRWGLTTLDEPVGQPRPGRSAGSASGWRSRRSTPPCSPPPTTTSTAWRAPSSWSPAWSGMLVGISALTTIGLRRYYAEQLAVPPLQDVCDGKSRCKEFSDLLRVAGIAQEHTVFWGRPVCAVVAAVLALVLFRQVRPTRLAARDVFTGGA